MSRFYQDAGGRWMTSTLIGFPKFVPDKQKPADQCQPFDTVGRILDLEKQVAELRALLVGRE